MAAIYHPHSLVKRCDTINKLFKANLTQLKMNSLPSFSPFNTDTLFSPISRRNDSPLQRSGMYLSNDG